MSNEKIKHLDHISDEEIENDIQAILLENKNYSDEKDVLMRNPQQNRLRIYLLEGHISANEDQLKDIQALKNYREQKVTEP
jgi:hypothetical protein